MQPSDPTDIRRADLADTSATLHRRSTALITIAAGLTGSGASLAGAALVPAIGAHPVPTLLVSIGLLLVAGGCLIAASVSKDRAVTAYLESRFSINELDAGGFLNRRSAQRALEMVEQLPDFEWTENGAQPLSDNWRAGNDR